MIVNADYNMVKKVLEGMTEDEQHFTASFVLEATKEDGDLIGEIMSSHLHNMCTAAEIVEVDMNIFMMMLAQSVMTMALAGIKEPTRKIAAKMLTEFSIESAKDLS